MKPVERRNYRGPSADEIKQLQDSVARAVDPIARVALLDGVVVTTFLASGTFTNVAHGLGRPYQGWIVIGIDGNATVREDTTALRKDLFISMSPSAGCTVKLWVF